MDKALTQEEIVVDFLKRNGTITNWQMSYDLHILSGPKIISNIRKNPSRYGGTIKKKNCVVKCQSGRYTTVTLYIWHKLDD